MQPDRHELHPEALFLQGEEKEDCVFHIEQFFATLEGGKSWYLKLHPAPLSLPPAPPRQCYTVGLRMRTAVVVAIYRKSLLLSLKERHAHGGAGEIANLVGIDAQRIQDLMTYLHAVWYSFFQIGLAMYFLWGQVSQFSVFTFPVVYMVV